MSASALSRRGFLIGTCAAAASTALARRARAEEVYAVGLVLPAEGGTPIEQGAGLGLDEANALATLFGKKVRLDVERAGDAAAAARAAAALSRGGALAIVGGAGPGVADGLRDAAASGGALFLNAAAIDDRLRQEQCGAQMFHFVPSVSMYVDAAALLADRRGLVRWAVAGDGTPRAAEVDAAVRRVLGRRPSASLVTDGSADLVFLAGEPAGVREALAKARAAGRGEAVIGIGGEVPDALPPDEAAGLWIVGWNRQLERFSASELNNRFTRRFNRPLTETSWAAWAALKLVGESLVRASAANAADVRAFLVSNPPFDGHKGAPLTFRPWDLQLRQPVYALGPRKRDGAGPAGGFTVLGDLPGANLDAIGIAAADSRCQLSR